MSSRNIKRIQADKLQPIPQHTRELLLKFASRYGGETHGSDTDVVNGDTNVVCVEMAKLATQLADAKTRDVQSRVLHLMNESICRHVLQHESETIGAAMQDMWSTLVDILITHFLLTYTWRALHRPVFLVLTMSASKGFVSAVKKRSDSALLERLQHQWDDLRAPFLTTMRSRFLHHLHQFHTQRIEDGRWGPQSRTIDGMQAAMQDCIVITCMIELDFAPTVLAQECAWLMQSMSQLLKLHVSIASGQSGAKDSVTVESDPDGEGGDAVMGRSLQVIVSVLRSITQLESYCSAVIERALQLAPAMLTDGSDSLVADKDDIPVLMDALRNVIECASIMLRDDRFPMDAILLSAHLLCSLLTRRASNEGGSPLLAQMFVDSCFGAMLQESEPACCSLLDDVVLRLDSQCLKRHFNSWCEMARIQFYASIFNTGSSAVMNAMVRSDAREPMESFLFAFLFPAIIRACQNQAGDSTLHLAALMTLGSGMRQVCSFLKSSTPAVAVASDASEQVTQRRQLGTDLAHVATQALDIVWNNWDHPVKSVADSVRNVMDRALDVHDMLSHAGLPSMDLVGLVHSVLDGDWKRKSKYVALSSLLPRVGVSCILERCPDVFSKVLNDAMDNPASFSAAAQFYNQLALALAQPRSSGAEQEDIGPKQKKRKKQKLSVFPDSQVDNTILHDWQTRCLLPISKFAIHATDRQRDAVMVYIVPNITALHPSNLYFLIKSLKSAKDEQSDKHSESESLHTKYLQTAIGMLRAARKASSLSSDELFSNDVYRQAMMQSIVHDDEILRFATIDLVTRNNKMTEVPTETEFELLERFLSVNLSHSSSYTRNRLKESTKRFFSRVFESAYRIFVTFRRSIHGTDALFDQSYQLSDEKLVATRANYWKMMRFVHRIAVLLNRSMYPGAPHEKMLLSVDTYALFIDAFGEKECICVFHKPQHKMVDPSLHFDLYSTQLVSSLVNGFLDCWDNVRTAIYDLLERFPSPLEGYQCADNVNRIMDSAVALISSPRLRECDAGSLMINVLFQKYVRELNWHLEVVKRETQLHLQLCETTDTVSAAKREEYSHQATIEFISTLLQVLKSKTDDIQQNIISISQRSSPVGTLLTIRTIFDHLNIEQLLDKEPSLLPKWQKLATDILSLANRIVSTTIRMISDVQHDDNLEDGSQIGIDNFKVDCRGHLYFDDEQPSSEQNLANVDIDILIANAWLAVKETCMLAGALTKSIPLPVNTETNEFESDRCVLSHDQWSELGKFFLNILLGTKHKGVIEKGHIGFTQLCARLLDSNIESLYRLPFDWLRNIIERIEMDEASILRRSAGLPFAMLAILDAEPDNAPRVLLPFAASKLLEMSQSSEDDSSSKYSVDARVNAINLLKAIFQDGVLANSVTPFIEQAFINVLNGFFSPHWSVRNSSMICYAALLMRSIGSMDTSNNAGHQNSITGSEFFSRYPLLREYLLQQLQEGTDSAHVQSHKLHVALYPILLLLSRLAPSFNHGSKDSVMLQQFTVLVQKCASLKHYGARSIASRALVPLVPASDAPRFALKLLHDLHSKMQAGSISSDLVHGSIMQVYQFFTTGLGQALSADKRIQAMKQCLELLVEIGSPCIRNNKEKDICGHLTHFLCLPGCTPLSNSIYFNLLRVLLEEVKLVDSAFVERKEIAEFIRVSALRAEDELFPSQHNIGRVAIGLPELQDKAGRFLCSVGQHFGVSAGAWHSRKSDMFELFIDLLDHESMYVRHAALDSLNNWYSNVSLGGETEEWWHHVRKAVLRMIVSGAHGDVISMQLALKMLVTMYLADPRALAEDMTIKIDDTSITAVSFWKTITVLRDRPNPHIRQEAIRLQGIIIKELMKAMQHGKSESSNEKNALSLQMDMWIMGLERYSGMDHCEDTRLSVQQSIEFSEVLALLPESGFQLGGMFCVWKVCVQLLQDEDEEIRSRMGKMISLQTLTRRTNKAHEDLENGEAENVHLQTRLILERAFTHVTEMMPGEGSILQDYVQYLLQFLDGSDSLRQELPFDHCGVLTDVELFEKDEDVLYKEDLLNVHIALRQLSVVLSRCESSLLDSLLDEQLTRLEELVSITVKSAESMADFQQRGEMSIMGVPGGMTCHPFSSMLVYRPLVMLLLLNLSRAQDYITNNQVARLSGAIKMLTDVHGKNGMKLHPMIQEVVNELGRICQGVHTLSLEGFHRQFLFLLSTP